MVFNKKEFKNLINQLKPTDFNYVGNFGSARFVKKESSRTIIIGIGYNEYFPHSALIRGVLASIYFNDVEEIIDRFLEKYQIKGQYGNTTIEKVFVGLHNVDYSKFELEINNEESFTTVAEEIKKILNFGVMPFFEKYNSLSQVAELLADKTPEKIVPYIQGSILFPKTILILKLAKHPSFMNKLKEYYDILLKRSEEKEIDRQMLTIYKDLFFEEIKEFCYV